VLGVPHLLVGGVRTIVRGGLLRLVEPTDQRYKMDAG